MEGEEEVLEKEEKGHCRLVIKCDRRHFVQ